MKSTRWTSRSRSWISVASLIAALLALWWFVLPTHLGGRTTFFLTKGISMEPYLEEGDLAVLHKASSYQVGDVVAFHSDNMKAVLLHRIIDVDDTGRLTTKGDNNSEVDLDHPLPRDVIGRLDHVFEGAGKNFMWLKSTPVRIVGALLVAWAVYGALDNRRTRRTNDERDDDDPEKSRSRAHERHLSHFLDATRQSRQAITTLVVILVASALVFTTTYLYKPRDAEETTTYALHGDFAYSAMTGPGGELIYRDGQVATEDPIYIALVDQLFVTYSFSIDSPSNYEGGGLLSTNLILTGPSGWNHTVVLQEPTPFEGTQYRAHALIDISELQGIVRRIAKLTNVATRKYVITLASTVELNGELGGEKFTQTLPSELAFNIDDQMMKVQGSGGSAAPDSPSAVAQTQTALKGLKTVKNGELTISGGIADHLSVLGLKIGVLALRLVTLAVFLLSAIGLAWLMRSRRQQPKVDVEDAAVAKMLAKYKDWVIPVSTASLVTQDTEFVDVESLLALVKVAESHRSLILKQDAGSEQVFMVSHGNLAYRYRHRTHEPA